MVFEIRKVFRMRNGWWCLNMQAIGEYGVLRVISFIGLGTEVAARSFADEFQQLLQKYECVPLSMGAGSGYVELGRAQDRQIVSPRNP